MFLNSFSETHCLPPSYPATLWLIKRSRYRKGRVCFQMSVWKIVENLTVWPTARSTKFTAEACRARDGGADMTGPWRLDWPVEGVQMDNAPDEAGT